MDEALRSALCEALSLAARVGEASVVRKLLAAGADPNVRNENGSVPLALALNATNCRIETVRALLEGGASPHVTSIGAAQPIVAALYAATPSLDVLKLLLDAGADANAVGGKLLARAVDTLDFAFVRALVEAGADVNQAYPLGGPMDLLPFEIAAKRARVDVAQFLVAAGAVIPESVRQEAFWDEGHASWFKPPTNLFSNEENPVRRLVNADTMRRTIEQVMAHDTQQAASAGPSPL